MTSYRIKEKCPPVAANPSETHGLPCAFITHREDLLVTETLLLWEEDERGWREKRGRWSWGEKRKMKRIYYAALESRCHLRQLSSRFERFPGESNYRSISTLDKRKENKQKPAIPRCFPVLLCFTSPSGGNVGTIDAVWKILTLKKLPFDIHTI